MDTSLYKIKETNLGYKVPFVGARRNWKQYGKEYMDVLEDRLSRGELVFRQDLLDFEKNIAVYAGVKHAKGVNSGFDALHLSLRALGVGPGDEVITVAHTFIATLSAIILAGAKIVLIDVGEDWNMDMNQLEKAITPKTKAIIPVYLNGRLCDMDKLAEIVKQYEERGQKIYVIEDAAQAIGAKFDEKSAGQFGETGCFSHFPFKVLGGFGEGGSVVTNDEKLADILSNIRYHGIARDPARTPKTFGFNAVLDNIQAAILNIRLKYYDEWIARRREIAEIYRVGLQNIADLKLPHFDDNRYFDIYQNYVIQTPRRDELRKHFESDGEKIETIVSWPVPIYKYDGLHLNVEPLPMTEKICKEVISLPLYPELTNEEVNEVIASIKRFYSGS